MYGVWDVCVYVVSVCVWCVYLYMGCMWDVCVCVLCVEDVYGMYAFGCVWCMYGECIWDVCVWVCVCAFAFPAGP